MINVSETRPTELTVILKPTANCNMKCLYCDVAEPYHQKLVMSSMIMHQILIGCSDATSGFVSFLWHGGEPLLIQNTFFKETHRIQERYLANRYENWIQTNASLITQRRLECLSSCGFRGLGTSLDGPDYIHDKARRFNNEKPSHKSVMKGVDLARKHGLNVGAVAVISKNNVHNAAEVYYFFREEQLPFSFIPIVSHGRGLNGASMLSITAQEYSIFLLELLDLWLGDSKPIPIHTFEDSVKTVATGRAASCIFTANCVADYLSIDYLGDVYLCNCFAGVKKLSFGNILTSSLTEILNSPLRQIWSRPKRPVACRLCKFWQFCYNGCKYHAFAATGNPFDWDPFCSSYKKLFERLSVELKKVKNYGNKDISI